jgi:hypothetical protein
MKLKILRPNKKDAPLYKRANAWAMNASGGTGFLHVKLTDNIKFDYPFYSVQWLIVLQLAYAAGWKAAKRP